ncbi:unnamed protein product [Toxocara canis]|nr:unnamed protein product [Toxocara canis]
MNLADLSSAPGVRAVENSDELSEKIAQHVSTTNSKLSKTVFGKTRDVPIVGLFDLNTAVFDSSRRLNLTDPFTHHRANTTWRHIYKYAYHDLWNPSTFVHHAIAERLVKFLEDL